MHAFNVHDLYFPFLHAPERVRARARACLRVFNMVLVVFEKFLHISHLLNVCFSRYCWCLLFSPQPYADFYQDILLAIVRLHGVVEFSSGKSQKCFGKSILLDHQPKHTSCDRRNEIQFQIIYFIAHRTFIFVFNAHTFVFVPYARISIFNHLLQWPVAFIVSKESKNLPRLECKVQICHMNQHIWRDLLLLWFSGLNHVKHSIAINNHLTAFHWSAYRHRTINVCAMQTVICLREFVGFLFF